MPKPSARYPPNGETKEEINVVELDKAISDMQATNVTIDNLRKTNGSMLRCCEGTRTYIEEREVLISSYQSIDRFTSYPATAKAIKPMTSKAIPPRVRLTTPS